MDTLFSMPKPLVDMAGGRAGKDAPTAAADTEVSDKLLPIFVRESFVTEEDSKSIVSNVFMSVGLMIGAMIIAAIFYWSYHKNVALFICILSALVFLYTIKVIIVVVLARDQFKSKNTFMILMGGTVFMCLLTLILTIMFGIKASPKSGSGPSSSISSTGANAYIPSSVNDYIGQHQ